MGALRRTTISFDPELHQALRAKASATHQSISDLVNEAVRQALAEDALDLASFRARANEPNLDFKTVLKGSNRRRKL